MAEEKASDSDAVLALLKAELTLLLEPGDRSLKVNPGELNVWMFVGVNGVGKTTTIAKLAQREVDEGHNVVLAAADTFRAAAADQLGLWAERAGAGLVRGQDGADPGLGRVRRDERRHARAARISSSSTPPGACTPRST